jgi:amino acid transporter
LALVLSVAVVNVLGVRHGATLQNLFTFGLLAAFAVFASLGLLRGSAANLLPGFPDAGLGGAMLATLVVLQIVPYYMAGFETVSRCAEERRADFTDRHFEGITLAALVAAVFFYASVIVVVALLHPWQELVKTESATVVAFRRAFGSEVLVNVVLLGAILSLIKVYNGCFLAATRQLFAMGRAGMVLRELSALHSRRHTPWCAIVLVSALAAGGCLLGKAVLMPISEVGSFAYAVGWMAASFACCCGVAGGGSRLERWVLGPAGIAVTALMLGMKLVPLVPGSFTPWEYAALAGWVGLGTLLWALRPRREGRQTDHFASSRSIASRPKE